MHDEQYEGKWGEPWQFCLLRGLANPNFLREIEAIAAV
jgi:hypothetical protein